MDKKHEEFDKKHKQLLLYISGLKAKYPDFKEQHIKLNEFWVDSLQASFGDDIDQAFAWLISYTSCILLKQSEIHNN
jgi:hypothetical protein